MASNGQEKPGGDDRRNMKRVDTLRGVLYSRLNATGPLHEGLAVDMSAGGMRIQTRFPIDSGTEISIELKPRPEDDFDDVIILRGRIVHVIEVESGEFAMGVKLILKSGARMTIDYAYVARVLSGARGTSGVVARGNSNASGASGKPMPVRYRKVRSRTSRRWRNLTGLLVVSALIGWWLLPAQDQSRVASHRSNDATFMIANAARLTDAAFDAPDGTSHGSARGSASNAAIVDTVSATRFTNSGDPLFGTQANGAYASNDSGTIDDASEPQPLNAPPRERNPFAARMTRNVPTPIASGSIAASIAGDVALPVTLRAREVSPLFQDPGSDGILHSIQNDGDAGQNDSDAGRNDGDAGRTVGDNRASIEPVQSIDPDLTFDPINDASALPVRVFDTPASEAAALQNATVPFAERLAEADAAATRNDRAAALETLDDAFRLPGEVPAPWLAAARRLEQRLVTRNDAAMGPMNDAVELGDAASRLTDAVRIEIDRARYTLDVIRGDELVGSFPVGLGQAGATPAGDFQIANKICQPDWYNGGDVVPAGDPANPLGASWMGLGTNGKATSYGIHPTEDAGSIGEPQSRGCIRMWPEDAETLFRLCPIGTPVRIR